MPNLRGHWALVAALAITLYGALLRLDAFTQQYGALNHPQWARFVTQDVAALAPSLRPSSVGWSFEPRPYVGGDPYSYLKYAREMSSFYQPHVREPLFLATVRACLWALDGQDAAVSLASALASVVAIFATYLLGAALLSRAAGLIAAALMAIEYQNITWAVYGWRDDLFTATFVLSLWALLRFRERGLFRDALVLALLMGAACLTRITALSFLIPGLLWLAVSPGGTRRASPDRSRPGQKHLVTVVVVFVAVVAPYLISCWIATGDPFFSINEHTTYYRSAEGIRDDARLSAVAYLRQKVTARPVAMADVVATGLFVGPFEDKWLGFNPWLPALRWVLGGAALVGLAIWIFCPVGRLMLLMLVVSLLPYAFTWNLGGGREWRFTMHAYPIYLLAAMQAGASLWRLVRKKDGSRIVMPSLAVRVGAVAVASIVAAAVYVSLPWFVAREAIANGEAVTFGAGRRDWLFYRNGWSPPRTDGNVTARTSVVEQAAVHIPLPQKRAYEIILRLDPVRPDVQQRLTVLFNRQLVDRLRLSLDPERVGSYRVALPVEWVRRGGNEITLVSEAMVEARSAGPRFAWIDPEKKIGVRLWYVRVLE